MIIIADYNIISLASEAPRHVSSFCSVIVWQAPSRAYGVIMEYQVSFFRQDMNDNVVVSKRGNELFHLVNEMDLPRGEGDILIMVCMVLRYWVCQQLLISL